MRRRKDYTTYTSHYAEPFVVTVFDPIIVLPTIISHSAFVAFLRTNTTSWESTRLVILNVAGMQRRCAAASTQSACITTPCFLHPQVSDANTALSIISYILVSKCVSPIGIVIYLDVFRCVLRNISFLVPLEYSNIFPSVKVTKLELFLF